MRAAESCAWQRVGERGDLLRGASAGSFGRGVLAARCAQLPPDLIRVPVDVLNVPVVARRAILKGRIAHPPASDLRQPVA